MEQQTRARQETRAPLPFHDGSSADLPAKRETRADQLAAHDLWALQHGLEVISAALALLDPNRRLVFANPSARTLFDARDGVMVDPSNEVRCRDREAQGQLQAMVAAAMAGCSEGVPDSRRAFAIPRDRGWPLSALISCRPARPGFGQPDHRVVLLLRDPGRDLRVRSDDLSLLFGLSRAEAIVVQHLASGLDLEQIAARRGVCLTTIRNQLKAALGKLGVSRQVELVSIVLRSVQF